ncbi:MAG TPA: helix-turn-helix domain-containing protein [Gaiellaceae bacterium]|nr:helix-turn-helix domain-containing protein [Gaiellaceae bacterium]
MARPYPSRRPNRRAQATRERIMDAIRELLAEGVFHESTMDQVAERARIARATLYQHFRSRLDLVDAICETFDANPALLELRDTVDLPDAEAALGATVAASVRFWSSENAVLRQLYGAASVDPAARDLVARQRSDRRGEIERLVANLRRTKLLRPRLSPDRALATLMVLTSYETFGELRASGLSDRGITALLQEAARRLVGRD